MRQEYKKVSVGGVEVKLERMTTIAENHCSPGRKQRRQQKQQWRTSIGMEGTEGKKHKHRSIHPLSTIHFIVRDRPQLALDKLEVGQPKWHYEQGQSRGPYLFWQG